MTDEALIFRLRKRAEIRLQAKGRKSVEEGKPDRLADLLFEAADALDEVADIVFLGLYQGAPPGHYEASLEWLRKYHA